MKRLLSLAAHSIVAQRPVAADAVVDAAADVAAAARVGYIPSRVSTHFPAISVRQLFDQAFLLARFRPFRRCRLLPGRAFGGRRRSFQAKQRLALFPLLPAEKLDFRFEGFLENRGLWWFNGAFLNLLRERYLFIYFRSLVHALTCRLFPSVKKSPRDLDSVKFHAAMRKEGKLINGLSIYL